MNKWLLIDDDEVSNFINKQMLTKSGKAGELTVCISALKGLELLNGYLAKHEEMPEVILLDIRMPIMDGFGFLEELNKMDPSVTGGLKIAMLTSSLEEKDRVRASQYRNVVDFINKPLSSVKIDLLLKKIQAA